MTDDIAEHPSCSSIAPYSKNDLLGLLCHYEAELQAKDVALLILQAEKARITLEKTKSVKLGPAKEGELALLRDSAFATSSKRSYSGLSQDFCRSQLHQLDHFVSVQKACNKRAKQALNLLEKRHSKVLQEIDLERRRENSSVLKSDDVFALIENERLRFQAQLDKKDEDIKMLENELEKCDQTAVKDRERHKLIVLYLINERRQLLLELYDSRLRASSSQAEPYESTLVKELKKQVLAGEHERDNLNKIVNSLNFEKESLRKHVNDLEENLLNVVIKAQQSESLNPKDNVDGLIMANRQALAKEKLQSNNKFNAHNSASFPTTTSNFLSSSPRNSEIPSRPQIVSARSHLLKSGSSNFANTANVNHSNHSTVLLQRPTTRPPTQPSHNIPTLGIKVTTSKASNLPINRNLAGYRPNRRPVPELNFDKMNEIIVVDSAISPASLTKRSSSLPRNMLPNTQFLSHPTVLASSTPSNNNNVLLPTTRIAPNTTASMLNNNNAREHHISTTILTPQSRGK